MGIIRGQGPRARYVGSFKNRNLAQVFSRIRYAKLAKPSDFCEKTTHICPPPGFDRSLREAARDAGYRRLTHMARKRRTRFIGERKSVKPQ
jgi:hypothetical protein